MGRSSGLIVSVKIPIRWGMMTKRQRTRLNQITGRDSRIIKAYLGVIERNETDLLTSGKLNRVNVSKLDKLTLTASRGVAERHYVLHDFKKRFTNISVNEFQECRDTAVAMWQSYLEKGGSKPLKARGYTSRKIPRFVFKQRFEFIYTPDREIKHWLVIRDSLDSSRRSSRIHDKLAIPLSPSSYHLNKMNEGIVKTVRLFRDSTRKWWAIFTVTLRVESLHSLGKPSAVFAIDLGIKKTACTVLLTRSGYKHVRYWRQGKKIGHMKRYDKRVACLQREKEDLLKMNKDTHGVAKELRELNCKRNRISIEYDRKLVKDLCDHILEISEKFDLYVCIGRVKGIRNRARKGNHRGRAFRGMIHRWSFARVSEILKHKLETLGYNSRRFYSAPEAWTSIMCHKCGHKGMRPKQNLFICHTCGYRANADLNGAINIGRRHIMLIPSLRDEKKGLGMWLLPKEKATLKARRKKSSSKRKSSLSQRGPASVGESVADCYDQTSVVEFASSKDLAMVKAVETPSASSSSGNVESMQRTEAGSRKRNHVPVKSGKAHVILKYNGLSKAGDSSREKGGTQEFLDGLLTNTRSGSS